MLVTTRSVTQGLILLKQIEQLVPDIQKLFDGHKLSDIFEDKFGPELTAMFVSRFKAYGEERENTLWLSNVGWPLRKLWYSIKGHKGEALPADAKVKFLYGDLIESLFIALAREAGHTVEHPQREVEVDGVTGHIDCVIDGVLIDVKSASTPSFKKFKTGEIYTSDPFGYVAQLSGYKQALGLGRAGWFIIDKTLGHFDFVELKEESNYDIKQRIRHVRTTLESSSEPARCYTDKPNDKQGNRILDTGCSYCSYKDYCWRDSNEGKGLQIRSYYGGPRYFTALVKEPRLKQQEETYETFPIKEVS